MYGVDISPKQLTCNLDDIRTAVAQVLFLALDRRLRKEGESHQSLATIRFFYFIVAR